MKTHRIDTEPLKGKTGEDVRLREAVAVFPSEAPFLAAVDGLLEHGFDRADLSVLAHGRHVDGQVARMLDGTVALAEDGSVPRGALAAPASIAEAKAASVALPVYAGTIGGFLIAVASGGALAFTIPVAIAGGLVGSGLGLLGATAISNHYRESIERQLANGGILLWVRTETAERERKACEILEDAGGEHVHLHTVTLRWGEEDVPFAHTNPDPLLERGPDYD